MSAWIMIAALAVLTLAGLKVAARFDRTSLQLVAAALLFGLAGYVWQGRPDLPGKPVPPPAREGVRDSEFAMIRRQVLGEFDAASRWLTIAEHYQRKGDTESAVGVIRSGLKARPREPDLWIGLGNALLLHSEGVMTPAVELAFRRAGELAPGHPAPKFFHGLAFAQTGRLQEAEAIWSDLLEGPAKEASWKPLLEERLALVRQARQILEENALPSQGRPR